jgi:chromo domain-containing protein 1
MSSDDVMNDTSDNDPDREWDSLASSVDSDQDEDKSYYVETIYVERVFEGQTQYLVKWAEYPAERATWEPVDMFDDEEGTLQEWEMKKQDITSGKQQPFDLESWERHCVAINEYREDRRQRREKRISGGSSSRSLVDPRKPTHEPKIPSLATKDTPSTRVISQETSPTSKKSGANQPLPKRGLQTSDVPIGQADKSPYATVTKAVDSRDKRRRLETPREPPAPAIQTPRPAPSGFATGGKAAKAGYRSHIFGERVPDVTKLDLIRPSQYPDRTGRADIDLITLPFTTGLNYPHPPGRKAGRSGPSLPTEDPVKSSSEPRAQNLRDRLELSRSRRSLDQGDNRPSSVYSRRENPTRPHARSRSPNVSLVAKRSNATAIVENSRVNARAANPADPGPGPPSSGDHSMESQLVQMPRRTSAPNSGVPNSADPRPRAPSSGDLSMESQLAQMPRRIPGPSARKLPNGFWFNPKEALMTMFFGADKKFIGHTRACGIPAESQDLIRNKPPGDRELQICFEHLCTTSEFIQLRQLTPSERFEPTVSLRCTVLGVISLTDYLKIRSLGVLDGLRASMGPTANCSKWQNICAKMTLWLSTIRRMGADLPMLPHLATPKIPNGPVGLGRVTFGMHQVESPSFSRHAKTFCR